MKVTAIIDDALIDEVKSVTGGKNITESITIALKEYLRVKKLDKVFEELDREPFQFNEDFQPYGLRDQNRKR
ncbi:type II toxin-antitoxin system VapB family antitoxin [Marinoscillum sp.]|uniref:type II toxin-antitoxin system VapB family antitoxin n=1 Tax=Marinoscillum sp. TaxID=2024838 RepID=UPI003BAD3368